MVDNPARHVWVGLEYFCSEGDRYWTMDDESFTALAVEELRHIGVLGKDASVIDSVRIKVKKAYPAYFGSYSRFSEVRSYLDEIPNLYCIGRNGQHRYNNMDHSMLCGIEAVTSLLEGSDRSRVWNVNTEETYHEAVSS